MASKGPQDIELAEVHDCFTIAELLAYEDLGFCKKGEAGRYIEEGHPEIGGDRPGVRDVPPAPRLRREAGAAGEGRGGRAPPQRGRLGRDRRGHDPGAVTRWPSASPDTASTSRGSGSSGRTTRRRGAPSPPQG